MNAYKVLSCHGQGKTMLIIFVNPGTIEVLVGISVAAPFARVGPGAADV